MGCPYCGEKIVADARLCRFCNRNVLYSLTLSASLDEKQAHLFVKHWQNFDKKNFKHLPLSNYTQAKQELSKIPLTLAWDLSHSDAHSLSTEFREFHAEAKLQGGLPSTFASTSEPRSESSLLARILLVAVALSSFGGTAYFWLIKSEKEALNRQALTERIAENEGPNVKVDIVSPASRLQERLNTATPQEHSFGRAEMEHLLNASVFIRDNHSLGSGFMITADGYILTNAHVTAPMTEPTVILRDGRQFTATKIKEDLKLDAALLKISVGQVDFLELGDANELYPGQPVITIGNPGGLSFTVTRGVVSYLGRVIGGVPFIQTDAAINRGNSGGPMINEALQVVGINSMTSLAEQGISFALPINLVCSGTGIATGIRTTPRSCEAFHVSPDIVTPASLMRQKPEIKNPDIKIYQSEIDSLKAELDRSEKDLVSENDGLTASLKDLQRQAAEDPYNLTKQQSIQSKVSEIQEKMNAIPKKRAEAQLRYLKQCISVLERQKADPDFSSVVQQIEQQIQNLETQRKTVEALLGR